MYWRGGLALRYLLSLADVIPARSRRFQEDSPSRNSISPIAADPWGKGRGWSWRRRGRGDAQSCSELLPGPPAAHIDMSGSSRIYGKGLRKWGQQPGQGAGVYEKVGLGGGGVEWGPEKGMD